MSLGVAALIVVLSVMNGFQGELRGRLLNLLPHVSVAINQGASPATKASVQNWLKQQDINAVSHYLERDVLLVDDKRMQALQLSGLDVGKKAQSSLRGLEQHIVAGNFALFSEKPYSLVLGAGIAKKLRLAVGDKVTVMLPSLQFTPFGAKPRIKQFTLVAVFQVGADVDYQQGFIRFNDAQKLLQKTTPKLQIQLNDVLQAEKLSQRLQKQLPKNLKDSVEVYSWAQTKASLFSAVKMEKTMVGFMLSLVIAVAAFNLLSVLSMMVAEKRLELAVLAVMGLRPTQALLIFLAQGMSLALTSIIVGSAIGLLLAYNLTAIVHFFENLLGVYIFDPNVFYITGLPSEVALSDVLAVVLFSFILSLLFSLYPAYRAANIKAIEAMQD